MANSLAPAFVKVNYVSQYGAHVATCAAVPYILPDVTSVSGKWDLRGAEISVAAEPAIIDLVELIAEFHADNTVFVDYTIFTQADPESPAEPQYSGALGIVGAIPVASGGWHKASQSTFSWRTDTFGLFKIVLLDFCTTNLWDKRIVLGTANPWQALSDYVTDDSSWLAGRDGGAPNTFLQESRTLNEKLRRSYRMN